MGIETLDIDRLIVHTVPSPRILDDDAPPPEVQVHGALSPLGDAELNFVRMRLLASIREDSYGAILDPELDSDPIHEQVARLTAANPTDEDVVEVSQQLAHDLFEVQPASASDGLLIVATASVDGRPACVLLKLEREEGMRTEEEEIDGETAVRLIIEQNLVWTENTTVFKTGLFMVNDEGEYDILVTDVQTGNHGVAHYWRRFLACTYEQTPDQSTLRFYEETLKWINGNVEDPERRNDYVRALHTELASNRRTFSPTGFAKDHLKGADRTELVDALSEAGISTSRSAKDTARVAGALRRLKVKLDGIELTAEADAIDRVTVKRLENGSAQVTATGKVRRISGSGH